MGPLIPDSPVLIWFLAAAFLTGTLVLTAGVIWGIVKIVTMLLTCSC